MTATLALLLGGQDEAIQQLADQVNPANARGPAKDDVALLTGTLRQGATRSTALATLTGTPGTVVPAGLTVRGGDVFEGEVPRWELVDPVQLDVAGFAEGTLRALNTGPITADLNTINEIETPVVGLAALTNGAAATPGSAPATDAELERQRQLDLTGLGSNQLGAMLQEVSLIDDVQYVRGVQNREKTDQMVEGLTLPPKSYAIVVYPPNLGAAAEQEIFDAIRLRGPGGIKPVGTTVGSSLIPGTVPEQFVEMAFYYAVADNITVEVAVELEPTYLLTEVAADVETAVSDYQSELEVGASSVRRLPLLAKLDLIPGIKAAEVTYNGVDDDYDLDATRYPILSAPVVTEVP